MIFEYLKAILVNKNDKLQLDAYYPFLISRWLSFSSTGATKALNCTVNQLGNLDKEVHYKLLLQIFPKQKYFSKINYIKKVKKEEKDDAEIKDLEKLAKYMEVSTREVRLMLSLKNNL